ncbi:MAG: PDZ domain-containing protein [Elusimicrobiota bacterium]
MALVPIPSANAAEPAAKTDTTGERELRNAHGEFSVIPVPQGAEAEGQSGGVGVRVGVKEDRIVVQDVVGGGPAEGSLKKGDVLLSINGVSTKGMSVKDAAQSLRGKPDTLVVLRVKKGLLPWGKKVPLIRSASVWTPKEETPRPGGLTIKKVAHSELGVDVCPKEYQGCLLLLDEDRKCWYTCKQ